MGIDVSQYEHFTVSDFSGGLNEEASSFQVKDNELVDCQNVSLRDSGAIKNRLGYRNYHVWGNDPYITFPVKGMHRYTASDGTKKILIYTGTASTDFTTIRNELVLADDGAGDFDAGNPIAAGITTNDGFCRFAQYLDCVLFMTDRTFLWSYNPLDSSTADYPNLTPAGTALINICVQTTYDSGGYLEDKKYVYRFSYDRFHGDVFLGETSLEHYRSSFTGGARFSHLDADMTAYSGNDGKVEFAKRFAYSEGYIRPSQKVINVYRAGPYTTEPANFVAQASPEFFYIGSFTREALADASIGDVVFTDDGAKARGRVARYGRLYYVPQARFLVVHKNLLCLGNVHYDIASDLEIFSHDSGGSGEVTALHRVFFSCLDGTLPEPIAFYGNSWLDVDPTDGVGITQMISFHDQLLVVFKANSMWAVLGDNPSNFALRNISQEVGCIASESLAILDGRLIWLSNRGIYFWDGTGKPQPLKTEMINKTLFAIPEQARTSACGIAWGKEREYWLAYTSDDPASAGYNKYVLRYSAKSAAWTRQKHGIGISYFLESKDADRRSKLLVGRASDIVDMAGHSVIQETDVDWSDTTDKDGTKTGISWSFKTGFYDHDLPFLEKNFIAVLVQIDTWEDVTLDVFCDNRLDTTKSTETSFTISRPNPTWELNWWDGSVTNDPADDPQDPSIPDNERWKSGSYPTIWPKRQEGATLVMLDTRCWGKRIALRFSGTNSTRPVEIQAVTVFYAPREGEET